MITVTQQVTSFFDLKIGMRVHWDRRKVPSASPGKRPIWSGTITEFDLMAPAGRRVVVKWDHVRRGTCSYSSGTRFRGGYMDWVFESRSGLDVILELA